MGGQPVAPELARAWENYFRQRGGIAPDAVAQALPVIILDDNSKGPYPPYRSWFAGRAQGLVAAQFTYIGIANNDPLPGHSVAVVDEISFRINTAVDDLVVLIESIATFPIANPLAVKDAAPEKDQAPSDQPLLGNVVTTATNSATNLGLDIYPSGSQILQVLRGPWTLGPGEQLLLHPNTVANAMFAYFRGRYYAAP